MQQTTTAKLAAFFQKFQKTVQTLRVNETRVTSINTFFDNHFALKSEKEAKNDERTLFWEYTQILDLAVNP